jgi:cysteinyl-tRNA synthetase
MQEIRRRFRAAMDDDFNAPAALAVLFDLAKEVNIGLAAETPVAPEVWSAYAGLYRELAGDVLGLLPTGDAANADREDSLMQLLIELRREARANKNWALSDAIRDRLVDIGIILEDGKDGTAWKIR